MNAPDNTPAPKRRVPDVVQVVGFVALAGLGLWMAIESFQVAAGEWMTPSPGRVPMPMWTTFALACGISAMSLGGAISVIIVILHKRRSTSDQREDQP